MNHLLRFISSACLLLLMVVSTSRADTTSNLKTYWPFTQGSGADASGNGFTATLSNTTPVDDRYATPSSALSFNGTSSSAEVTTTFAMTNQQTYCAWIKPMVLGDRAYPIFDKAVPGWGGEIDLMFLVYPDNKVYWYVNTDDGATGILCGVISSNSLVVEQWYFVAGVIDKSTDQIRLYINGALEGHASMGGRNIRNTNRPFRIGRRISNQATASFNGSIDEARIYDRALSASDILELTMPIPGYTQTWADEFSGSALDSAIWTLRSGDSAVVAGGTASILSPINWSGIVSSNGKKLISSNDFVIEFRARRLGNFDLALALSDGTSTLTCMESSYGGNQGMVLTSTGAFGSSLQSNSQPTEGWKEYRLTCKGTMATLQRGNTLASLPEQLTRNLDSSFGSHSLYLNLSSGGGSTAEFDWIRLYQPQSIVNSTNPTAVYGDGRHGDYNLTANITVEQLYQNVRLSTDLVLYDPANPAAVPQFRNLTISNNAVLTANAWDGTNGGNVTLKVQGVLLIAENSEINIDGKGYTSGPGAGSQGQSYYSNGYGSWTYMGGGGGSFGTSGGAGVPYPQSWSGEGGSGGIVYGDASLNTVLLGSSGGPSGGGNAAGRGAGCVFLSAARISVHGLVSAKGADGTFGNGPYPSHSNSSGGGGGSGGAIKLKSISVDVGNNHVIAAGGAGGNGGAGSANGGGGGAGRIRLELGTSQTITTTPAASVAISLAADQDGDSIPDFIEWGSAMPDSTRDADTDGIFDYLDTDSDNDGIPDSVERGPDMLSPRDTNNDGFPDYVSIDSDADGVLDSVERGPLPLLPKDSDGDGSPDFIDTDSNNNGIPDLVELGADGLRRSQDTDADGIPDFWETFYSLNPASPADAAHMLPGDTLTFWQRFQFDLSGFVADTDGDEISDADELFVFGTQTRDADSDGDGLPDAWEKLHGLNLLVNDANLDADGDGLTNAQEYNAGTDSTNPRSHDSDSNGVSDYEQRNGAKFIKHRYDRADRLVTTVYNNGAWEGWGYDGNGTIIRHVLKLARDADSDGLADTWEFAQGLAFDSSTGNQGYGGDADGDGWTNQQEFLADTAANDATSIPPTGTGSTAWATPPKSRIVFPAARGGALAHVSVRLWDAEANRAQATLHWWDATASLWKPATLSKVNNGPITNATSLTTTPAGTTHDFLWNALADLPAYNGTILLRTTSQDPAGTTTSETVPYALNTAGDFDGDGIPDTFEIANGLDPNSATGTDGTTGDSDHDGFNNFAEFAFHMSLGQSDAANGPAMSKAVNPADGKTYLTYSYRRRLDAAALNMTYTVQTSTDMRTWTSNIADIEPISTTPTGDGVTETVTVRIKPPLDTPDTQKFVHVEITR